MVDSIQSQKHGLNLTTISLLKLTVELLLIFTASIYSLRYDTLITGNWDV